MVQSGDYIDIQFQDGKRYKKPVGIYWLQSAAAHGVNTVTGGTDAPIWAYRIPSFVGGVLAVLFTFWIARAFVSAPIAGAAGLLMAGAILLNVEARIAKTDAFLLATILAAIGVLARAWIKSDAKISISYFALFWGAIGFGILLKGPIVLLIVGLATVSLSIVDRSVGLIGRLRPLFGVLLAALVAVPWFVAIGIKSEGAFFVEAGLVDFLAKVTNVKESHGGPPGIYAAVLIGTLWPVSLFFLTSVPTIIRSRKEKLVIFCLCWLIPSWLVFELTSTKLPHYVLPLYPALAIVTSYVVMKGLYADTLWKKILTGLWFVLPFVLTVATFGGLIYLEGVVDPFILLSGGVATFAGYMAWQAYQKADKQIVSIVFSVLSAFAVYVAVFQFTFPKVQTIWVSNQMQALLEETDNICPAPSVISVGYNEPSFAFLAPIDMRFKGPEDAALLLAEAPCRQVFVTNEAKDTFLTGLGTATPREVGSFDGFKLNGGDPVTINLFTLAEGGNE